MIFFFKLGLNNSQKPSNLLQSRGILNKFNKKSRRKKLIKNNYKNRENNRRSNKEKNS
jgi:hypothetical protein